MYSLLGAGASSAVGFRIIESSRLEETFEILKSHSVCFGMMRNGWVVQWFVETKVSTCEERGYMGLLAELNLQEQKLL